jgi:hypothetical protein
MGEREDYADNDLPPPRTWLREGILPILLGLGLIGVMIVGLVFVFLLSLQKFD